MPIPISIHSLRVEGDYPFSGDVNVPVISIHSLRVEGDQPQSNASVSKMNFNPLPPCGGRRIPGTVHQIYDHFNPLPPCGGRLCGNACQIDIMPFQSTPSVWRETVKCDKTEREQIFQSTPSVWRETLLPSQQVLPHSFQSTPSVWRETLTRNGVTTVIIFQSTPSVWRETTSVAGLPEVEDISIHSLRVEGDFPHHLHR